VVVLKDAVATLSAEAQRSTLNSLAWSVARILTADQAIAELEAAGK